MILHHFGTLINYTVHYFLGKRETGEKEIVKKLFLHIPEVCGIT